MDEFAKFLPQLPGWISIPIILITLIVSLGPKLLKLFMDLDSEGRALKREKERLSILKLRYEIEAFRKEKNLSASPDRSAEIRTSMPVRDEQSVDERHQALTPARRFMFGALGAAAPSAIRFALNSTSFPGLYSTIGFFVGMALLAGVGGGLACLLPKRRAEPFICFLVGLSFTLAVTFTVRETQPLPVEIKQLSLHSPIYLQGYGANKITGANAGRAHQLPMRTRWAARVAQFYR